MLASSSIGAKLQQQRVSQGATIDEVAGLTRIPARFLDAIEKDDFTQLPGLVFTRNFVRQYAVSLKLDPEPLLAELPRIDESQAQLPDPPAHPRSFEFVSVREHRSIAASMLWVILATGAGIAAYTHFRYSDRLQTSTRRVRPPARPPVLATAPAAAEPPPQPPVSDRPAASGQAAASGEAPVNVTISASAPDWLQISADGKIVFTGTLQPDETKEFSAAGKIKVLSGNAGSTRILLNGRAVNPIGPAGQVRTVTLTAAGPQFPTAASQP